MSRGRPELGTARITILPDPDAGPIGPDGPVRSTQGAELEIATAELERLWRADTLERLAQAYWRYLRKVSLGAIRVVYGSHDRSVVLFSNRIVLLRFREPLYDTGPGFGRVTWPIERGFLVVPSGRGRGYLRIDVRRPELEATMMTGGDPPAGGLARVLIKAEVANFYPLIRGSGRFARIGAWIYSQTQVRMHRWVTHGFLRSLTRAELPPLRPGREGFYTD